MKVLITGGGGFIAAWIIRRLLNKGHAVRILDAKADRSVAREIVGAAADLLDWRVADIADRMSVAVAAEGCDAIFHLAAVLTPACAADPIRGAEINLIGTLNVFEAARVHRLGSVIYMSSAGVFGPDDGKTPRPTTHYGAFKLACEGSARAYWIDHRIASVGVRPLIVYRPGRETGLTAGPTLACRAAAEGRSFVIPFSGGSDFLYVDDIAAAFVEAATTPLKDAHAFNLTGIKSSAEGVVAEIKRIVPGAKISAAGPSLPVSGDIEPGDIRNTFPTIPLTNLAEGLAATIAHYREQN